MIRLFIILFVISYIAAQQRNYSNFPCPQNCVCFRRTVRCMKIQLNDVPPVALHTSLLDLRFNNIRNINPGTFKDHRHIRSLLLNDNLLSSLNNGAFTGLTQIRHLYLYKNKIKHIDPEVFQGLSRLEHLYLHNNEIEEFDEKTFSNLRSLDRLFLYNNKIKHIPSNSFSGLPRLTRLRLDSNALVCDCKLSWLPEMFKEKSLHIAADCKYPLDMHGKSVQSMKKSDFHCETPEIIVGPKDVEVSWGGTAVFTCRVAGDVEPPVVWMRNDSQLPYDDRYHVMDDGTLMIENTQPSDVGHYECMIKNNDGEVKSRKARMIVKQKESNYLFSENVGRKPKFIIKPQSISAAVGVSEIQLECLAAANPQPTVTWSQNGITLASSSRRFVDSDGTLFIRSLQADDYGTYRCEASNPFGRISATAEVLIDVPPTFSLHPVSQDIEVGQTIKLECAAVGSPTPKIIWYKDDIRIELSSRIVTSEDGTVLNIQDAKESDSGLYVCEARNALGYRETSANVKVKLVSNKPPKLIYKPYDVEAILGSTIELPCKAEGDPAPGVQWRKDGSSLQRNGRTRVSISGNLYITGVAPDDAGRYECSTINEYGRDTASGYVTIKEEREKHRAGLGVGDKLVRIAFAEASQEVDAAINRTIDRLFHNRSGPPSSEELFRIIRFPNAPARELARAAEVYERTLVNIRKHVNRGMSVNATSDFNYQEILTPEHLDLIAKLSGCMTHRQVKNCTDMCYHLKYRSIDGTCNNLQNPTWGASLTAFRRILKPIYENGFSTPIGWNKGLKYNGFPKPSSRLVSSTLLSTETITSDEYITHMVMQWGQFLDHDLDHAIPSVSSESWDGIDCKKSCDYAAPCYPIDVPPGDKRVKNRRCIDFFRSSSICGSGMTSVFFDSLQPREQINQLTSYIDASQVYGFSEELARQIRDLTNDHGYLRVGPILSNKRRPLLPYAGNEGMDCRRNLSESNVNCFLAGDIRANEQIGLLAMHTIWVREHNRITDELRRVNPHWDGETLYQEARKVVGAAMQHITYKKWLPHIVGPEGLSMLGEYKGYDPTINPSISNVFGTAALRFGHTLINPILHRFDSSFNEIPEGHLPLFKAFFSPWRLVDEGGVDPLMRGFYSIPAKLKRPNENLNTALTEHLFETAHAVALDLAAMNIHRSRDHAIPGYTEYRKFCNMSAVNSFEDLQNEISTPTIRRKLEELYGHPDNIDVFVGGILEDQAPGARVGPLFRCLLVEQFKRLRDGDRFFYENPSSFKPEQLAQIKQYSLGRVLCDTGDNITQITNEVFLLPNIQNGYKSCAKIPKVDFRLWSECCTDNCAFSNTISRIGTNRFKRSSARASFNNSTSPADAFSEETKIESITDMHLPYEVEDLVKHVTQLENIISQMQNTIKIMDKKIKKLEKLNKHQSS